MPATARLPACNRQKVTASSRQAKCSATCRRCVPPLRRASADRGIGPRVRAPDACCSAATGSRCRWPMASRHSARHLHQRRGHRGGNARLIRDDLLAEGVFGELAAAGPPQACPWGNALASRGSLAEVRDSLPQGRCPWEDALASSEPCCRRASCHRAAPRQPPCGGKTPGAGPPQGSCPLWGKTPRRLRGEPTAQPIWSPASRARWHCQRRRRPAPRRCDPRPRRRVGPWPHPRR